MPEAEGSLARPFKRQFNLTDYVQVKNATFENGLLRVELAREVPEAIGLPPEKWSSLN